MVDTIPSAAASDVLDENKFQEWATQQARYNLFSDNSDNSADPRINVARFAWKAALRSLQASPPAVPAGEPTSAEPIPQRPKTCLVCGRINCARRHYDRSGALIPEPPPPGVRLEPYGPVVVLPPNKGGNHE